MDKVLSKKIFIKNKVLTPKYLVYSFDKSKKNLIKLIEKKLKFPVVIKPINEGSSVNVFICTKMNIMKNLKLLRIQFHKQIKKFGSLLRNLFHWIKVLEMHVYQKNIVIFL